MDLDVASPLAASIQVHQLVWPAALRDVAALHCLRSAAADLVHHNAGTEFVGHTLTELKDEIEADATMQLMLACATLHMAWTVTLASVRAR